jgi:hypothetical protein
MNETRILIRLLRMYIPRNWEFGSALAKHRNFGSVVEPPKPLGTPLNTSLTHTCYITSATTSLTEYLALTGILRHNVYHVLSLHHLQQTDRQTLFRNLHKQQSSNNNTGQQNLTFFLFHEEKYLILIELLTFNAEFKYASSFSPSPTVFL